MTAAETQEDRLFREAFDLIIRLKGEPDDQAVRQQVLQWRNISAAHETVWAQATRIDRLSKTALINISASERPRRRLSRRDMILLGGGAAMAAAVSAAVLPTALLRFRAEHLTAKAEMREIRLSDGSVVTLGPDSAIRSSFRPDQRHVELLEGMAYFDVTPDAKRPFRVSAEDMTLSVLGTAFDIGLEAGNVSVAVSHGRVEVVPFADQRPERLVAGQWLSANPKRGLVTRGERQSETVADWRNGLLNVENENVATVIARIARWQSRRTLIADASLGREKISGTFHLDRPVEAIRAAVQPHGGHVRAVSPWLLVISRI